MSNSGLVFPIIVALWLVYLVPQWIRRREHLSSSSRAPHRFSAAMRVLSRRQDAPAAASRPGSGSYVLSPPRAGSGAAVVAPPLPLRDHGDVAHSSRAASGAPRRSPVPGLVFLATLLAMPVLTVLAVVGVVGPWWPLASVGLLAACVVLLRRAAVRRREARRAGRPSPQRDTARPAVEEVTGRRPVAARVVATESEEPAAQVDQVRAPTGAGLAEPPTEQWTPVPVPPPTYTLKPSAPARRVSAWVADVDVAAASPGTSPLATAGEAPERAPGHLGNAVADAPAAEQPAVADAARPVMPDLDLVLERRRASGE